MDISYKIIGNYKITHRCIHSVTNLLTNITMYMCGDDLYTIFKANCLSDRYIDCHAECFRKKHNLISDDVRRLSSAKVEKDVLLVNNSKIVEFEEHKIVGDYKINNMCEHIVSNELINKKQRMCGDQIYSMLKDNGLLDGYFDCYFDYYAEYVRKRDHPTPEEIAEKKECDKIEEEELKNIEARKEMIRMHSSSSRLEKIKQKNNLRKGSENVVF